MMVTLECIRLVVVGCATSFGPAFFVTLGNFVAVVISVSVWARARSLYKLPCTVGPCVLVLNNLAGRLPTSPLVYYHAELCYFQAAAASLCA